MWLSDGGVYDNMAEQWESGIEDRLERWRRLGEDHPSSSWGGMALVQEPAEVLILANASAGWTWRPFGSPRGLIRESVGLIRDQGVQYDVSTTRRRRALFQTWTRNEEVGDWPVGVIVMIDRSPHHMAAAFVHGDDDRAVRAREAIEYLGDRRYWDDLAERNGSVATTLEALGVDTTVDLIEQSYVATLVGLYVLHGIGSLIPFDRHRFESLCGERASLGVKAPEIRSTEPRSP